MNGPGKIPHPIPYQGSKRQLAPQILRYFPTYSARVVEPFAGSAAISIAVSSRKMAGKFWVNDGHKPLIDLWREILLRPVELADNYEALWHDQQGRERQYFDDVRERFNETHQPSDFLYLLARCVKAVIRYNSFGQFNNTPDNRRCGAKPPEMRRRIMDTASLLSGNTQLTSWDYKKVLSKCDDTDLIYMDPPYRGVSGDRDQRYLPTVDHDEFCNQLAVLNDRVCLYVISYDGRTGSKTFGEPLPKSLDLIHLEIKAGRSSQATLLGRDEVTYESLYLSPALASAIEYSKSKRQLAIA